MDNSKEYLMLREEILHLDTIVNNTINFFYVFVSATLLFAVEKEDSWFILISYVVIIPAYLMVLSKKIGLYKIAAYQYVFHEGKAFKWETRQKRIYEMPTFLSIRRVQSFNFPFIFVSTFVTIIFCIKTNWNNINLTIEFLKVVMAMVLYIIQIGLVIKNRKVSIENFITIWEDVKKEE